MLKLTDQEKQEIIRHLESNRDLPEKYRFLLFGDKREVELVWNGKTNEVCNIVLLTTGSALCGEGSGLHHSQEIGIQPCGGR